MDSVCVDIMDVFSHRFDFDLIVVHNNFKVTSINARQISMQFIMACVMTKGCVVYLGSVCH